MDKFEFRRLKLQALISSFYNGKQVALAESVGITPDYISRCLYPEGKSGKKRIGEATIEKIEKLHPGWFKDGYIGQFEFLINRLSEESREKLLEYASMLYIKEHPEDRLANPFPATSNAKEESR